jgi:hypothetical protein
MSTGRFHHQDVGAGNLEANPGRSGHSCHSIVGMIQIGFQTIIAEKALQWWCVW